MYEILDYTYNIVAYVIGLLDLEVLQAVRVCKHLWDVALGQYHYRNLLTNLWCHHIYGKFFYKHYLQAMEFFPWVDKKLLTMPVMLGKKIVHTKKYHIFFLIFLPQS